ncbi:MAG: hypothetical protein R2744_10510 [Bacteroidales bacterium]
MAAILFPPDRFMRSLFLRGNRNGEIDTKYGNITVTGYNGDNHPLQPSPSTVFRGDPSAREENIHYAMLAKPGDLCLLVSGSMKEHLQELHKYLPKTIVYLKKTPIIRRRC